MFLWTSVLLDGFTPPTYFLNDASYKQQEIMQWEDNVALGARTWENVLMLNCWADGSSGDLLRDDLTPCQTSLIGKRSHCAAV